MSPVTKPATPPTVIIVHIGALTGTTSVVISSSSVGLPGFLCQQDELQLPPLILVDTSLLSHSNYQYLRLVCMTDNL